MTEQFCWLPKTEQLDIMEMSSMARASNPTSRAKAAWLDAFFWGGRGPGSLDMKTLKDHGCHCRSSGCTTSAGVPLVLLALQG